MTVETIEKLTTDKEDQGLWAKAGPRRIGKFYSSLSTFFCKLFIFFVERMTEN